MTGVQLSQVKVRVYTVALWETISLLCGVTCHVGTHLPPDTRKGLNAPQLNPSQAGQ